MNLMPSRMTVRVQIRIVLAFGLLLPNLGGLLWGQAPDVEIVPYRRPQNQSLISQANAFREAGNLLCMEAVREQMDRRVCKIDLPEPKTEPLSGRELWALGRSAHVWVGWHYLCHNCDNWHQRFAGGYFINDEGAVATCQHVIDPERRQYREGYLVVASVDGDLFPVLEVLASDPRTDAAILRVQVDKPVTVLPLNVNVYPGDDAWCYSEPLGRAGYFSKGIINRFYNASSDEGDTPRLEVSTDWAPGSSGAAIVDVHGNAIGHVATIEPASSRPRTVRRRQDGEEGEPVPGAGQTMIVFRSATRAADVLALIETDE